MCVNASKVANVLLIFPTLDFFRPLLGGGEQYWRVQGRRREQRSPEATGVTTTSGHHCPPAPPPPHMCHKHGTRLSTTTTQHTGVCGKCLEESRLSVAATIPRVTKGVEPHCSLQTNSTFGDHLHFTRHPFKSFMKHETPRGCQTANSEAQLYISYS